MRIIYQKSFLKNIKKIDDKNQKKQIEKLLLTIKNVDNINEIKNLKKLKRSKNSYRIKLNNYRLTFKYFDNTIHFYYCLHRKDIYKFFPLFIF